MKAPFSEKAKTLFKDKNVTIEVNKIMTSGGKRTDGAKIKLSSGKSVRLFSSKKASLMGFRK